jgi:hypothetical protein
MIISMTITVTCIVMVRELRQHGSGHSQSTFLCCPYWLSLVPHVPSFQLPPFPLPLSTSPSLAPFLFPITPCLSTNMAIGDKRKPHATRWNNKRSCTCTAYCMGGPCV